jgi:predicted AAA+ superfamily ATPase
MTDYFHRDLAPTVFSALEEMPVVVIIGLRQTGKTTFLRKQPGNAY